MVPPSDARGRHVSVGMLESRLSTTGEFGNAGSDTEVVWSGGKTRSILCGYLVSVLGHYLSGVARH